MLRGATLALLLAFSLVVLTGFAVVTGTGGPTVSYHQLEFTINSGGTTPAITVPAVSVPIHMMVAGNTCENRVVGQATILRAPHAKLLEWVGMDMGRAVTSNYTAVAGTHIIYADFAGNVDVQVASAIAIQIHNHAPNAQHVVLTFIY